MRKFLFGLIAATLVCSTEAFADEQNCQLQELGVLPMSFDPAGRPAVMTSMEGQQVLMLVDTGGTYSMVTRATVDRLHLKPQNIDEHLFYMMSGEAIKSMASAHNFQLGRFGAPVYSFLILPYGWEHEGTGGTIGPDILAKYDTEFDFDAMKMHIWSPAHCPGKVVYWTQQAYMALPIQLDVSKQIHFTAMVDGKEMDALLDTGSTRTVMRLDMARATLGWQSNPPDLKCSDDGEYCRYPFKSLSFGGVSVANPDVDIMPDKLVSLHERGEVHERIGTTRGQALIIGTSVLKKLHLYIAYKEGMVYATGAGAH